MIINLSLAFNIFYHSTLFDFRIYIPANFHLITHSAEWPKKVTFPKPQFFLERNYFQVIICLVIIFSILILLFLQHKTIQLLHYMLTDRPHIVFPSLSWDGKSIENHNLYIIPNDVDLKLFRILFQSSSTELNLYFDQYFLKPKLRRKVFHYIIICSSEYT